MKKLLFAFATFLVFTSHSHAQKRVYEDFQFGLKGGINVSGIHGSYRDTLDLKYKIGFNFGVYGKYFITDKLRVGFEALMSRRGYKADVLDSATFGIFIFTHNLYQIEGPLFLEYQVSKLSSFELGAAYAMTFYNERVNFPGINPFEENAADITAFVGYNYAVDDLTSLGFRYNYGLNPIVETSTTAGFSSTFQVFFRTRLL